MLGKGYPMLFVTVTAPVLASSEMPAPAAREVTPVLVMVRPDPTTDCPAVTEMPPPAATEPVATLAKVFAPEKYGMFPTTAGVEVVSPPKVKTPVPALYARGKVAEREEEEIFWVKVVQSADERKPAWEPFACWTWMVVPLPKTALVPPPMERMEEPVSVRLPRVVVARAEAPFPRRTVPDCMVPHPVPPTEAAKVEEEMRAVPPAFAMTGTPPVKEVAPVPPEARVRAEAKVREPSLPKVEVAVAPKYAGP